MKMDCVNLAIALNKLIKQPPLFLECDTDSLLISNSASGLKIPLKTNKLLSVTGLLNSAIFDQEGVVLSWDLKNYFSFIKRHARFVSEPACKIYDLKILEHYLGQRKDAPKAYSEVLERFKALNREETWNRAIEIYKQIHIPLLTSVIPALEAEGMYNTEKKMAMYPYYEIEGQVGGRLSSEEKRSDNYNPHTLSKEKRQQFRPLKPTDLFVCFDYKHIEISVLQWLVQDSRLDQVLNLEHDFYKVVYKLIFNKDCDTAEKRDAFKTIFIGVIYGLSAKTLAVDLKTEPAMAEVVIQKIYKLFPQSFEWIQREQDKCGEYYCDRFGRKRRFEQKFKVRNFLVQAPTALVCLEKLIGLQKVVKTACSIYDGYVIVCNKSTVDSAIAVAKNVLESDSFICPGVKLKVSVKTGSNLAELEKTE